MKFLFVQRLKDCVAIICAWRLSVRKQSEYDCDEGGGCGGSVGSGAC
jgi:hypothetical protein